MILAHIFFDDAFCDKTLKPIMGEEKGRKIKTINKYVKDFLEAMPEACKRIYGDQDMLTGPTKVPTPYGGRLVYKLPGSNPLVCHLKDKTLIRHKKRWSQVHKFTEGDISLGVLGSICVLFKKTKVPHFSFIGILRIF